MKFIVILLIASQLAFAFSFVLVPKPAKAFWGVGDLTFNIETGNIVEHIKQIIQGVIVSIATQYSNKYLQGFIQKVSDKYRIKDFLYYDQYLSDYYISNLILKNVKDPDLKRAYNLMLGVTVTGNMQGFTGADPRKALIPQLKQAMAQVYINQGGIDRNKVYNPAPGVSDREYFATSYAYFSNPQSFTEQNLRGDFGAMQSNATTAAQAEVMVGNGLKAGRVIGGYCSNHDDNVDWGNTNGGKGWDPVSCAGGGGKWNASLVDQAKSIISNPTAFIQGNLEKAMGKIFDNNYDATNIYTQIGQSLGNFIFTSLNLDDASGTFNEPGTTAYNTNSTGGFTLKTVDLDNDGIPDGVDNDKDGKLITVGIDTCYHGEVTPGATPLNCKRSSGVATSAYFYPICKATDDAIDELTAFHAFQLAHISQRSDDVHLEHPEDTQLWGEKASVANNFVKQLIQSLKTANSVNYDNNIFELNRFATWLDEVVKSLFADQDVDLQKGFGIGGGGWDNLGYNTLVMLQYTKDFRAAIGKCDVPNSAAAGALPPPPINTGMENPPTEDPPPVGEFCDLHPLDDACPVPPADADTKHGNHQAEVAAAKQQVIDEMVAAGRFEELNAAHDGFNNSTFSGSYTVAMYECNRFEVTRRAAIAIGNDNGQAGLLDKPGGTNCGGRSVDIIAFPDGYIYDVMNGTAPDGAGPGWSPSACGTRSTNGTCSDRWRAP